MFGIIKKTFIELLIGIVNASIHTECLSLNNQKCMTQPTLINLHPNEYSQESHYYPFALKLDRCVGSCNTLMINTVMIYLIVFQIKQKIQIYMFLL